MAGKQLPEKVQILLPGGKTLFETGNRSLLEISAKVQSHFATPIVAAVVGNELYELTATIEPPAKVRFLDLTDKEGRRIYQRSLTFLLIAATSELFPEAAVTVEHSLSKGLYCEIKKTPALSAADVAAIEERMRQMVKMDLPLKKRQVSPSEAMHIFRRQGFEDKVALIKSWRKNYLNLYRIGDVEDSLHGYLVPRTGLLHVFALKYYPPGLILRFPDEKDPSRLAPFVDQKKLFEIFREADRWGAILGFDTVGAMNRLIEKGEGSEVIRVAEALHEKKIAQIADLISARSSEIRVILIAGPSCSGKTTFAQRLRIQLLVNGLRPLPISIDDYFVDREQTPLDESNNPDFEHIEAVDLPLFNEHLLRLIAGEEVEIPTYNFTTGKREYRGKIMRLDDNQPLIIEGIHGLNETLTRAIPRHKKYKIYISALTALNIDRHTRIHTTDTRLLRRIVRDAQFRGNSALDTIRCWPSVRRGEERNIFRLQEEADIMFNSALVYELAVIKEQAESLLKQINRSQPEYIDAKRLLTFLSFFHPLEPSEVPLNSILCEFIGQSCFFET
ncbi:MAG TPA: nucleoside kinase [Firmicutes bacterium]|jgi:uridine kinase|nr:nucleoside kinase [Bacillota bacterium]